MRNKKPTIKQVDGLLKTWRDKYKHCTVTTDQSKELGPSIEFQKMIQRNGYILQTTGTDASAENGLAEKPNRNLARIMRCLLYSARLGSRYWSYALRYAVYLRMSGKHLIL